MSAQRNGAQLHVEQTRRAQAIATSAMWPFIAEDVVQKTAAAQARLNKSTCDERMGMFERGKIAAYNEILALAKMPAPYFET